MKPKVAFICVHNSCRSQMAEAIAKHIASDTFQAYSAGTDDNDLINPTAVRLIKEKYQVDMNETQKPKLISEIPEVDIVITMGCNVDCPYLSCKHREDWGLDDPTGKSDDIFLETINIIENKIKILKDAIIKQELY